MLTRRMQALPLFIDQRIKEAGIPPSFDEMKEEIGLKSKSGIHRLVLALEERGFIRRLANRARAIEVVRLPGEAHPFDSSRLPAFVRWAKVPVERRAYMKARGWVDLLPTNGEPGQYVGVMAWVGNDGGREMSQVERSVRLTP